MFEITRKYTMDNKNYEKNSQFTISYNSTCKWSDIEIIWQPDAKQSSSKVESTISSTASS